MPMILLIAAISLAIWIYLLAFRGQFWRSRPVLQAQNATGIATIAVVVPARNEADSIRQSIGSLLAQGLSRRVLPILLVDDNSTDGTADTRSLARRRPAAHDSARRAPASSLERQAMGSTPGPRTPPSPRPPTMSCLQTLTSRTHPGHLSRARRGRKREQPRSRLRNGSPALHHHPRNALLSQPSSSSSRCSTHSLG